MFFVKSCHQEFNIKKSKTLKIGTLEEYRETEQAQIADLYEGTFSLEISLSEVHIEFDIFNALNFSHNSEVNVVMDELHISCRSPLFEKCLFLKKYQSVATFKNNNRFAFCISKLESHEDCEGIFKDYNDYWYFRADLSPLMASEISKSLFKSIEDLTKKGSQVFRESYDINKLRLAFKVQSISYRDRRTLINNNYFYKYKHDLSSMLDGLLFLKPESFRKENEIRFLFDFYEGDRLLHPKINSLIINASDNMLAITHGK
ncbi:hypothetical protein [Rahnella aceris]|jgi:hypothetical protein|uniref:hypothetical protein n=1 Tax=Rahnella sp. (strain Y9602) TaxID=2703885 RepID=UPI00142067C3|nr:hypothetical protein [Rahnella aceris]NIA89962.1 hypothetical protein [Rahnella aceris]